MPDTHGWPTKKEREIDALVAEKVMGLNVERDGVTRDLRIDHVIRGTNRRIPPYTTDLNAAWQVMQHLATRYNPKSRYDYEPFNRLTDALLGEREEIYPSYDCMYEIAKWTPDRICLASLRAVGVTIEE